MKYKNIFKEEFRITNNMITNKDYLKLSSILDIAQQVAGDHADKLGIGYHDFIKKDLIWVVARNRVEIINNISDIKKVSATTFAFNSRLYEFPRDVLIKVGYKEVAKIRQTWVVYNIKKNEMESFSFEEFATDRESLFNYRIRKIPVTNKEELTYIKDVKIPLSYCDHNGHLNNTHYLDFYYDEYWCDHQVDVKAFQIDYINQAYLNETISLYIKDENNKHILYGYRGEDRIFVLEVEYY